MGATFDASHFYDYYESVSWKVGRNKYMKNWKAAIRTWMRNENRWKERVKQQKQVKKTDFKSINY